MVGKKTSKQTAQALTSDKGYLMISLLFILILAGIMTQGVIKLSTNQLIQLNELSSHYQNQTVLNLAENIFKEQIQGSDQPVKSAQIRTSLGKVTIKKRAESTYELVLVDQEKRTVTKEIKIQALTETNDLNPPATDQLDMGQIDDKPNDHKSADESLSDSNEDVEKESSESTPAKQNSNE